MTTETLTIIGKEASMTFALDSVMTWGVVPFTRSRPKRRGWMVEVRMKPLKVQSTEGAGIVDYVQTYEFEFDTAEAAHSAITVYRGFEQ